MSFTKSTVLLSVMLSLAACSFLGEKEPLESSDFEMPDSVTIDLSGDLPEKAPEETSKAPDAVAIPDSEKTVIAENEQKSSNASNTSAQKPIDDADSAAVLARLNKPATELTLDPEQVKQAELAQSDYNRAIGELRKGNLDSAMARFKDLSTQYPALSGPIVNQAIILRKKGKTQEAYDLLQKSILQHGKNPRLLNELGVLSRNLGKFKQAQVSYESAIRIDEQYAAAHYNLGVLADLYLHEPTLALNQFEIYQTLIPKPDKKVNGWIIELQRRVARAP